MDWCGCSPNDFLPEDKEKLNKTARRDDIFFARKFEPIISQQSVDFLDGWISRGDPDDADLGSDVPGWRSYWQSVHHHLDRSPAPRSEVVSLGTVLAQLTLDTSQGGDSKDILGTCRNIINPILRTQMIICI